ncbi:MAG TPA: hypothetical protein VIK41_27755 [Gemmatimonadaceae bacterium]
MTLRTLLAHAIDYAGLFPPAQLDMPGAVAEYESYLASSDAWALGRFVVPAARLRELAAAAGDAPSNPLGSRQGERRLSVVLGADLAADVERLRAFCADVNGEGWWRGIDAVELRASTPEAIGQAMRVVPDSVERYVEIPISEDPTPLVLAIAGAGAYAKVRTGGTTTDAFPASDHVARFLATCLREAVPFKATAGLHHPLRGEYPLTYEPGSACGRMYGFLNVFLATAFLAAGLDEAEARVLLDESDPNAVTFNRTEAVWRSHRLPLDRLAESRRFLTSFGSCSFREPIDDLTALGLLSP